MIPLGDLSRLATLNPSAINERMIGSPALRRSSIFQRRFQSE
jgi:hypothetical protein